jgi:electron transfer flavoprotein beta subunit
MNIVVLIGGVHDPKWPIASGGQVSAIPGADNQVLSPFDEAALEVALRIRDANGDVRIAAYVAGGAAAIKIARAIASLNVADVRTVDLAEPWDQAATARALVPLCTGADLILIGREFGDFDDGLVPAVLAGFLEVPLFARVQTVATHGKIELLRESERFTETLTISGRVVASVTNDRRTRLRKPLMKNVMLARQAAIVDTSAQSEPTHGLAIEGVTARSQDRGPASCTMIAGDVEVQAQELAALLWEARP